MRLTNEQIILIKLAIKFGNKFGNKFVMPCITDLDRSYFGRAPFMELCVEHWFGCSLSLSNGLAWELWG